MEINKEQFILRYSTPTSTARSERDEFIQKFTDRINEGRTGTKYKPLTPRAIAIKLSHIPTEDLHAFYQMCSNANSFSRMFWYQLKPRKDENKT